MKYVVLDLNHWIYLSRAYYGTSRERSHVAALESLVAAVRSGAARAPLSFLHIVELLRNERPERRLRLAKVFDDLSGGWFVATWPFVLPLELERAVALALGVAAVPPPPEVFGRGYLFGLSPKVRAELEASLRFLRFETLEEISASPRAMRDLVASTTEDERLAQRLSSAIRNKFDAARIDALRPELRKEAEDLRHRLKFAQYTLHFQEELESVLSGHGLSVSAFCSRGVEFLIDFWSKVPSLHTDCMLTLYRDRQWSRPVNPNDFADLGHLVLALPYSSIVVTERFWARAVEETGVATEFGTIVCASLDELPAALAA